MRSIRRILTKIKRYQWVVIVLGAFIAWMGYLRSKGYTWMDLTGFEGKTIWDWLELLIIPATLLGVAALLDNLERKADRDSANKRAEIDREIARDNQREAALQNYFDAMTKLLLDKGLRDSEPEDDVRDIAQAKTLSTLERLDGDRKGKLVGFLYEIDLITGGKETEPSIISLMFAHLEGANLGLVNLSGAYLSGAILKGASLMLACLEGANLKGANLVDAMLAFSKLSRANLSDVNLSGANLLDADLEGANLEDAILKDAVLEGATMPDGNEYDPAIHTIEKLTAPKARGELLRNN